MKEKVKKVKKQMNLTDQAEFAKVKREIAIRLKEHLQRKKPFPVANAVVQKKAQFAEYAIGSVRQHVEVLCENEGKYRSNYLLAEEEKKALEK